MVKDKIKSLAMSVLWSDGNMSVCVCVGVGVLTFFFLRSGFWEGGAGGGGETSSSTVIRKSWLVELPSPAGWDSPIGWETNICLIGWSIMCSQTLHHHYFLPISNRQIGKVLSLDLFQNFQLAGGILWRSYVAESFRKLDIGLATPPLLLKRSNSICIASDSQRNLARGSRSSGTSTWAP